MKRLTAILLICMLFLCGCKEKPQNTQTAGEDTQITSRLENMIELQKMFFVGKVTGVTAKDVLIPKYKTDITKYTVYTVEVTESLDGIMPTGTVELYCMGTNDNFVSRINLKRGETYILDAQPWVYGDKVVYLMSIYQTAYPRIDTAGYVTLESEDGLLDCGTKSEYLEEYTDTKTSYAAEHPDFFTPANTLERIKTQIAESYETNNGEWFDGDFSYDWTPTDEFITTTRNKAKAVYDAINALDPATVTFEEITSVLK